MDQWSGDKWTLKSQAAAAPVHKLCVSGDPHGGAASDDDSCWYSETSVTEYDGIKVVYHQGRYRHTTNQIHAWAMYEYKMIINKECWNIITDENMKNPPASFPGSSSKLLTHDFCHLDSQNSDDVYTSYSFTEMGGRQIWPFYQTESFQNDLWIWVSPRRFAIISQHPSNENLNHFYSEKMHEHFILANRTVCWALWEYEKEGKRKKDRVIALCDDTRRKDASHENFSTGFEGKYGPPYPGPTTSTHQGKRKLIEPQTVYPTQPTDPTGMYTAQDMQTLNNVFRDNTVRQERTPTKANSSEGSASVNIGQVPEVGLEGEAAAQVARQLGHAKFLLSTMMEVTAQFAQVVGNLEQIQVQAEENQVASTQPEQNTVAAEQTGNDAVGTDP